MFIHTVTQGETLQSISELYQVSIPILMKINELPNPDNLVIGQTIIIRKPTILYTVAEGDTLYNIANQFATSALTILQNNPGIAENSYLIIGTELVIKYQDQEPEANEIVGSMYVNGYAYPFIDKTVLRKTLPFLSYLTIFSYGFQTDGTLIPTNDTELIQLAKQFGVAPVMLISTLTDDGVFSNELAHALLTDPEAQTNLINNIVSNMADKGYLGLDIDFEYVLPEDKDAYIEFIERTTNELNSNGYFVTVALAPKTSANQPGLLYEAHNYEAIGTVANYVLLMTYEWGYTFGPPMAVSPINKVREVIEYGVSAIPSSKINMGVPNYAYDWPLPFIRGTTKARSLGNVEAVALAATEVADIDFDEIAQTPFFYYTSSEEEEHVVWFDDARSMEEKLALVSEYNLRGIGIWNIMKYFPGLYQVLSSRYQIVKEDV